MALFRENEFEARGYAHHKGTVGPFENHWLNLALALILAAGLIALILYCLSHPSTNLM